MKHPLLIFSILMIYCQGYLFGQNEKSTVGEGNLAQEVEQRFVKKFVNRRPPPFQFVSLVGDTVSSKSLKGKIVVFNFWFTTCAPCAKEIPLLNELVEKFKNSPQLLFIAPALDQSGAINRFLKKKTFHYQIIPNSRDYNALFGLDTYPTHIIVGQDGLIKNFFIGAKENIDALLEHSINNLLSLEVK